MGDQEASLCQASIPHCNHTGRRSRAEVPIRDVRKSLRKSLIRRLFEIRMEFPPYSAFKLVLNAL
eukprot:COSAG02_NODE_3790_length_6228_cov_4.209985_2_plen_65_part_00